MTYSRLEQMEFTKRSPTHFELLEDFNKGKINLSLNQCTLQHKGTTIGVGEGQLKSVGDQLVVEFNMANNGFWELERYFDRRDRVLIQRKGIPTISATHFGLTLRFSELSHRQTTMSENYTISFNIGKFEALSECHGVGTEFFGLTTEFRDRIATIPQRVQSQRLTNRRYIHIYNSFETTWGSLVVFSHEKDHAKRENSDFRFYFSSPTNLENVGAIVEAIGDALSLVSATRVSWRGYFLRHGRNEKTLILRSRDAAGSAFTPLSRMHRRDEEEELLVRMIDYLSVNPMSELRVYLRLLWAAAGTESHQGQVLQLCTLLEAITDFVTRDIKVQKDYNIRSIRKKLLGVLQSEQEHSNHPDSVERVRRHLGGMSPMSQRDKLVVAASTLGIKITNVEVNSWLNLRKHLAHGKELYLEEDRTDLQRERSFKEIGVLYMLIYRMVLAIIGYRGLVTDYFVRPWKAVPFTKYMKRRKGLL